MQDVKFPGLVKNVRRRMRYRIGANGSETARALSTVKSHLSEAEKRRRAQVRILTRSLSNI